MLENIFIRNIVLIDQLEIQMGKGLCVMTGETGSGKSILLDALGLVIGYRSSSRLLRAGEKQGSVVAEFRISENTEARELLKSHDIDFGDSIILKRILYDDGRSRAFINDEPVTQSFLNKVGETLLEVHGQDEQRGLLNPSTHREILDAYAGLLPQRQRVAEVYDEMKKVRDDLRKFTEEKDSLAREEDYLIHIRNEIQSIDPQPGEEEELSDRRIAMQNKEKVMGTLEDVRNSLEGDRNLQRILLSAQNTLSRGIGLGDGLLDEGENAFESIIEELEQASIHLGEAIDRVDTIFQNLDFDGQTLEEVEERLFAIRGLARKLNIQPDMLPDFLGEVEQKLHNISNREVVAGDLEDQLEKLRGEYLSLARELSERRRIGAKNMARELMEELAPLKMERTVFDTEFVDLGEENWGRNGIENVRFIASTNPGMPMDNLSKIASGGELSRFMLAMKVILSGTKSVPTIIFDEIDTGIGGAVADAVGERLRRLSQNLQIMVVTHHPQVAAKGSHHLKVRKEQRDESTNTTVETLVPEDRIKELARMLSGENITEEALSAAKKLIG